MRPIDTIVIHCSATPEGRDIDAATIKTWHVDGNGWKDIGYHFVVRLNGAVEQGRPLDQIGAHVEGHNTGSIGICYVGGTDTSGRAKDTRTAAQRVALRALVAAMQATFPSIRKVCGHRDFPGVKKACPSFDVASEL